MKVYVTTFITTILLLTIFEMVLPKGKNGAIVKTIISIIVVTLILNSIINVFKNDFNNELNYADNLEYEQYLKNYLEETTENEIKTILKNNNFNVLEVAVILGETNSAKIILNNVINNENEHIDSKENAEKLIKEMLYLEGWEVTCEYREG